MKNLTTSGKYKAPNGQEVVYNYTFPAFDSLQDAVASLGEAEVLSLTQRQTKVDHNNLEREKVRVANGHSTRKPQTEEEKARAKADRQANASLLAALKAKGIKTLEDLQANL